MLQLDNTLMAEILACGHSRVPVFHSGNRRNVMGLLLVKRLLPVSPADQRKARIFITCRQNPSVSPQFWTIK